LSRKPNGIALVRDTEADCGSAAAWSRAAWNLPEPDRRAINCCISQISRAANDASLKRHLLVANKIG